MQPPTSDQVYSSYALDQGIPCFDLFEDNEMAGSNAAEAIWPHGSIDQGGGTKAPGDDVFHVTSHPTEAIGSLTGLEIHYWRRIGLSGVWEGPVVLSQGGGNPSTGPINYYVSSSPVNEDVAVTYLQDLTPGNPDELLQVGYMLSTVNGQDWITVGVPVYPDPLTDYGFTYNQITNYVNPEGAQSWLECGGEYDNAGALHIFWVEQVEANTSADCRLRHWSPTAGFSTVAQAVQWPDDNAGGDGGRDLVMAYPGVAFGDGQTNCSDGPANPSGGNPNSNLDYVYYIFEQYGGESAVEQADASASDSEGGPQMNLEFYLSASNDGGQTWMPPANLTNTKYPQGSAGAGNDCDGTAGKECPSERDPSMALIVNDAIHIQYVLDIDAGDAVYAQSSWTFCPVMYYKIPGGDDVKIPDGVCPVIAASFAARLTNQDPDCEYHAAYSPPGQQVEQLIVENFGNALMGGDGSAITFDFVDWLTVVPSGPYAIPPGGSQTSVVTMNAGSPNIQAGGEGLYSTVIHITHNDPSRPSPRDFAVDFFVFDEFYCPEFETLKTGVDPVSEEGVLYLAVSNIENFANQTDGEEGLARMNSNPLLGDSSFSIYDGTLLIAVPPDPDTLVYRRTFGDGNGEPGFRALGSLEIDTTAYGTNGGAATAFANQTTVDSTIGVDVTYIFPQNSDSAEFVLIKYKVFNQTPGDIAGVIVGNAIDFDVTPGPDSVASVQIGSQNTGHLRADYILIFQQGVDTVDHDIVGDVTAMRFKGGITSIQCVQAPRAWVASNDPWLFARPGGGFHEGYLYQEMTENGFEVFDDEINDDGPENDRHTGMVHEQNVTLTPTTVKRYTVGLVSSNTGLDDADIIATTKKAWKYAFGWQEFVELDTIPENTPSSYPYYAIGSHEDGLNGGCCGCAITEISDPQDKFTFVPGTDPCEGTIDFAGGDFCNTPYTATYRLQDLCQNYTDDYVITVHTTGECVIECECLWQGDYDEDEFLTALDLGNMVDVLFAGKADITDDLCPTSRMDFDFDEFATALDLGKLIDHLFAGGLGPCDPCDRSRNPILRAITSSLVEEIASSMTTDTKRVGWKPCFHPTSVSAVTGAESVL
jgi:hypothetical protein